MNTNLHDSSFQKLPSFHFPFTLHYYFFFEFQAFGKSTFEMATEKESNVSDIEKIATVSSLDVDSGPPTPAITMSAMQYRKLIWKMDLYLLPSLFALWFVSLIDRINIGSANIFGIQTDLHMNAKSNQFNVALIIAYVGLIVMEVPSNWLLKKTSPSKVLAAESLLLGQFNAII
jgi:hypothetical protein